MKAEHLTDAKVGRGGMEMSRGCHLKGKGKSETDAENPDTASVVYSLQLKGIDCKTG